MDQENQLQPPADTLGIHQVYPVSRSQSNFAIDVVFVHGLGGDSFSTWTKDTCLWIRDLLPSSPFFQNARILTFGYDATAFLRPFERSTKGRTFTFAEALLSDLRDKRISPSAKCRPIIFLGHSLGGIVIKSALRHAHALDFLYGDILRATQALVFFGTPHQGADIAVWGAYLGGVGRAIGLRNTRVVDELERWSDPLVELTVTFAELAPRYEITTFFETKKTHGVMIVPEGSARIGQRNEQARGLIADHLGVCKFTANDPNWNIVRNRLDAIAEAMSVGVDIIFPSPPLADPVASSQTSA